MSPLLYKCESVLLSNFYTLNYLVLVLALNIELGYAENHRKCLKACVLVSCIVLIIYTLLVLSKRVKKMC